ncbi:hypothetical protein [Stenotrophomonas sp. SXG-1]|uniref:hypothetical protein n=1 Tax=Stenotrophomonas sp. SXG-1 TaxID=2682487 RepID=UPI001783514B|nr:hypothetical protein [Stenotrophomonas sp. SXG-1]
MTSNKKLRLSLERAIQNKFGPDQTTELLSFLEGVDAKPDLWTSRGIKSHLADVITEAQRGEPQLIKRSTDELPVLVISLGSVMENFQPRQQTSFWEYMRHDMKPVMPLSKLKELKALPLEKIDISTLSAQVAEA